jgi:hypothetical protein
MKEQERIARQVLEGNLDDVARPCQPGVRVADAAFGLEAPRPQPRVGEGEARAAMIVLPVLDPHGASVPEDGAESRHTV